MTGVVDVIEGVEYPRENEIGCPLCGLIHRARPVSAHFGMTAWVAECGDCRVAYQSPRPSVEASVAYMNARWMAADGYVADTTRQRLRAEKELALVSTLVDSPGRLLDFGAGIGTFVEVARERGWDAAGVERSRSAAERAVVERGVNLAPDLDGAPRDLDLVTLWDVVEHLREPAATIARLAALVRPGGWVVIETGNWESWSRLAAGDAWGLYLFDHQYYFSPSSLGAVTAKAGLGGFRLLDTDPRRPPREPGPGATPEQASRWDAYRRGSDLWPEHAGIDIMVAAARVPPRER